MKSIKMTTGLVRRSSHEERGLKFVELMVIKPLCRRSSHEERGLKYEWEKQCAVGRAGRSSHEERGLKLEKL